MFTISTLRDICLRCEQDVNRGDERNIHLSLGGGYETSLFYTSLAFLELIMKTRLARNANFLISGCFFY